MFAKMGPEPSRRSGHCMVVMGSRILVFGGLGDEAHAVPDSPATSAGEGGETMVHVLETSEPPSPSPFSP